MNKIINPVIRFFQTRPWIIGLVIVVIFGLVGIWDVRKPNLYTCHDGESHVVRLLQYERTMHDGQFPVQWAKTLYGGIGSPVLMLNYQLPYYLTMIPRTFTVSIFDSFKLIMAVSFVGSGIFSFLVFRKIAAWQIATAAAVLYMWTPYHFLDLYVRCAFGEMVGFMFVPLIILGMWERSYLWLVAGWAGLFLSHPVMSAGLSPFLMGWIVLHEWGQKNWTAITRNITAYALAVGIAAFNLFPTLSLTRYTHYSPNNSDTYEHFVTLRQLVINRWGYGFSMPEENDQMSFAIGYVNILILSVVGGVLLLFKRNKRSIPEWYLFLGLLATFIFTHALSKPFYQLLHLTEYIDFPWRLLMIQVVGTPILLVWLSAQLPKKYLTIFAATILLLTWYTNRHHIHINATWPFDINYYVKNSGSGDAHGEYSSMYRQTRLIGRVKERLQFTRGTGEIDYIIDKTQELVAKLEVKEDNSVIRYNIMHFPGWNYRMDGYEMNIDRKNCWLSKEIKGDQDYSGLVECRIDKGTHRVVARWITPPIVIIGNLVSLASLGIYGWIVYRSQHMRMRLKKNTL